MRLVACRRLVRCKSLGVQASRGDIDQGGAGTDLGRGNSLEGAMSVKVDRSRGGCNKSMTFYENLLQ